MDVIVRAQLAWDAMMTRATTSSEPLPLDGPLILSYVVWPDREWPEDRAVVERVRVKAQPKKSSTRRLPADAPRPDCECHGVPMHITGKRQTSEGVRYQYICAVYNRLKYERWRDRKAAKKAERG